MHEPSDPLDELTPAQIAERGQAIILEGEYWQQVLADCGELADAIAGVTQQIATSTTAALALALQVDERGIGPVDALMQANVAAMPQLLRCMETVRGLIELANGRGLALDGTVAKLAAAAHVELDDDEDDEDDDAA